MKKRRYSETTKYSFSTHEVGITAPNDLDSSEWRKILSCWEEFLENNRDQARALVRRGIPEEIRGEAWKIISGGGGLKAKNPGVYEILVTKESASENCLKKDITRTYPTNKHFRLRGGEGQKALYNVLKVYSIMDPEVGYCQGMSFLCGVLVFNLNEVDAFWVLSAMLRGMNLRGLFLDGLPLLKKYIFRFTHLFRAFMPKLYSHFNTLGINPLFYSAEWFTTVFSYSTPMDVTARIWDVLLVEGPDYLMALALAVLKQVEETVLGLQFDTAIAFLKQKTQSIDVSIIAEADKFLGLPALIAQIDQAFDAQPKYIIRPENYVPPQLPPRKNRLSSTTGDEESPTGSPSTNRNENDGLLRWINSKIGD